MFPLFLNTKPVNYVYTTGTGDQLWYDERHDRWFRASVDAVNEAVVSVNSELRSNSWCPISVFYQCLNLKVPDGDIDNGFVLLSEQYTVIPLFVFCDRISCLTS